MACMGMSAKPLVECSPSITNGWIYVMLGVLLDVCLGPVVQNIVSLTSSLRGQLVKCFTTLLTNIFCWKNERSFCTSHIFSTKNIGIFEILTFEILMTR